MVQLSFFMSCAYTCSIGKTFALKEYFENWLPVLLAPRTQAECEFSTLQQSIGSLYLKAKLIRWLVQANKNITRIKMAQTSMAAARVTTMPQEMPRSDSSNLEDISR